MEKISLLIKGLISNIVFSGILFISAGKPDYIQGWVFLSANVLATFMNYYSIRRNSELINERSKPGEGIKSWDKLLLGLSALMYILLVVSAGLDSGRFRWTPDFNWPISLLGVAFLIIGQVIFLTARSQNSFFSSVVRIQKERGHTVCDTGLYKIVRHPGYFGMIVSLAGLPLITTSVWSALPTSIAIILLLIRTSLEDKTLMQELDGYRAYSLKTRYKLLPFVW